jgi:hypothetical protein
MKDESGHKCVRAHMVHKKCPKRRCKREGKDCQYRDKNSWIPTGRPRVMSHSFILINIDYI